MAAQVEKSLRIGAPVAVVWAELANFAGISRWAPNVSHSTAASTSQEGIGAVRRVQVGRLAVLETVTQWQPEQELAYTLAGLPAAAGVVTNTWRLTASGDATDATLTTTIEPLPGPPGAVVSRVLKVALGRADGQMLAGLAAHLNATRASWQVGS